jgi:nondiscriminating aspartyl-tRNA synthetase
MSAEDLTTAINAKGEEIRLLKVAKPPTLKDDLAPLIAELLALKVSYKEVTGEDFGGAKPPEKKKEAAPEKQREGPSKAELNKLKRKETKLEKRAEAKGDAGDAPAAAPAAAAAPVAGTAEGDEALAYLYGDSPLVRSATMTDKAYRNIAELSEDRAGQQVWIRGRLATSRAVGKGVFLVLRQQIDTVQGVMFQGAKVPKAMIKYAAGISLESVVDILAEVTVAPTPIESATVRNLELQIVEVHVVSRASDLPFQIDDAGRSEADAAATGLPVVSQDTSLNYRWVDLRTPANQAIFRIQSGVCSLFREFLGSKGFIEIHTPKLISGASEGGSNVFKLKYFDQPACLAQSPQLYKQMAAACGGLDRVYEIGPVFRAEDSNTNRHLCEFTGLDFEMAIIEHYYEALGVMSELFTFIFDGISDRFKHELKVISQQYPFEPIKYLRPTLRITFKEGIDMLRAAGHDAPYDEDISTPHEKALGKLVREKYETDFYIMDKYPLSVRPFYTMPDPEDPTLSNSYDLFIRGEEIVSGAQRIHDPALLVERAEWWKIPLSSIQSYVDAFKHGALPHAGGGIGLERVVMLYLGLKNIRKSSMFPRDPSRLAP